MPCYETAPQEGNGGGDELQKLSSVLTLRRTGTKTDAPTDSIITRYTMMSCMFDSRPGWRHLSSRRCGEAPAAARPHGMNTSENLVFAAGIPNGKQDTNTSEKKQPGVTSTCLVFCREGGTSGC